MNGTIEQIFEAYKINLIRLFKEFDVYQPIKEKFEQNGWNELAKAIFISPSLKYVPYVTFFFINHSIK